MYADDLLLMSGSLHDLQLMIDIVALRSKKLDLVFNTNKCQVIRIDSKFNETGCTLHVRGTVINFVTQLKYLGWFIISAKSFKISFHHLWARFYECFNSVYVKSHNFTEPVLLRLVNTYCKPYLLYGVEVVNWTASELCRMNYAYNSALCRLHKISFNSLDVIYGYSNLRSIDAEIELRTRTFFKSVGENRQLDCTSHVFSVRRVTCVFFLCFYLLCFYLLSCKLLSLSVLVPCLLVK